MARFDTSKGESVPHCHIGEDPCSAQDASAELIERSRRWMAKTHPKAVEIHPPTYEYNCHGYAFAGSHGAFNYPELFIVDDFKDVPFNTPRKGDVVVYMNGCVMMHSAVVHTVSGSKIIKVRSKWGANAAVEHDLLDVSHKLGEPTCLLRRINRQRPEVKGREPGVENEKTALEVQTHIARFLDPEVNIEVMLASSPAAAKKIIETLPGVSELIDAGPPAEKALLDLLLTEETLNDDLVTSLVLYLLQHSPSPQVKRALAAPLVAGRFRGINSQLAAEAFLAASGIETGRDDAISTARIEAQKIL